MYRINFKRTLSLLLCLLMLMSLLPMGAFATDGESPAEPPAQTEPQPEPPAQEQPQQQTVTQPEPEPAACEHSGGAASCTAQAVCEACGAAYGEFAAHSFAEGKCANCGAADPDYKAPCEHSYGEDGNCTLCGEAKSAEPAPAAHQPAPQTDDEQPPAECEHVVTEWYTYAGDEHSGTCTLCGVVIEGKCSGGTATCAMSPKCEVCDNFYGSKDPNNHQDWSEWFWENEHQHRRYCSGCGGNYKQYEDHIYNVDLHETLCTQTVFCTLCVDTQGVRGLNHSEATYSRIDEVGHNFECSTCNVDGYEEHYYESDTDTDCDCGYVRTITAEHTHSLVYKFDSNGHWQQCSDEACPDLEGSKTGVTGHTMVYTASGNIITAKCICDYEGQVRISTPNGDVFYGDSYEVQVLTKNFPDKEQIKVSYATIDGEPLSGAPVMPGEYIVSITCGGATAKATFEIKKKPVTATVSVEGKTFDNSTAATVSAVVPANQLVPGDSISITGLSGSFADVNSGENKTVTVDSSAATVSGTNAECYDISYPTATGTIEPFVVHLDNFTVQEMQYTGDAQSFASVTFEFTKFSINSVDFNINFNNPDKIPIRYYSPDAGENKSFYLSDPDCYQVNDTSNTDTTIASSNITVTGTGSIEPADLTVSGTPSLNAEYGDKLSELSVSGLTITGVDGEEVPGTWGLGEGQGDTEFNSPDGPMETCKLVFIPNSGNYKPYPVTVTPEILPRKVTVSIVGNTKTVTYDGKEHSVSGYTLKYDDSFLKDEDIIFDGTEGKDTVTGTDAGVYEGMLTDGDFKCKNGNFKVTFILANQPTLTIEKAPLTAAPMAVSLTKGDKVPSLNLLVSGLMAGDEKTVTINPAAELKLYDSTGKEITPAEALKTAGTYTIKWTNMAATNFGGIDNYTLTKTETAKFVVKNPPVSVSSSSDSGSYYYTAAPVLPSVTVPISGDEKTIHVKATVKGGTATIDAVSAEELHKVIGEHVETGTVTIDFTRLNTRQTITRVEIPADSVKAIADAVHDEENDTESLEIVLGSGRSIEFDAAALAEKVEQAKGEDITISIIHTDYVPTLTKAQRDVVGNRDAFDINVYSGGKHISDMGGKITVHVPYVLKPGEDAEGIKVYYVDENGERELCQSSYDKAKKRVNFITDHLSLYVIEYEPQPLPAVQEDADQTDAAALAAASVAQASAAEDGEQAARLLPWILLLILSLLGVAFGAFLLLRKRKE